MTDQSEVNVNTPTDFDTLLEMANNFDEQAKTLRAKASELRKVAKSLQKQLKTAQSKTRKKKERDPNAPKRQPAGFAKPTNLSPELCKFLDVPEDTLVARTDVTRQITEYIKKNELQNPSNKREIVMDAPLKALLKPPEGVTVTFFTLQTYLKVHFPSTKGAAAPVPEVKPVESKPTPKVQSASDKKKLQVKKKLEGGRKVVA